MTEFAVINPPKRLAVNKLHRLTEQDSSLAHYFGDLGYFWGI